MKTLSKATMFDIAPCQLSDRNVVKIPNHRPLHQIIKTRSYAICHAETMLANEVYAIPSFRQHTKSIANTYKQFIVPRTVANSQN